MLPVAKFTAASRFSKQDLVGDGLIISDRAMVPAEGPARRASGVPRGSRRVVFL